MLEFDTCMQNLTILASVITEISFGPRIYNGTRNADHASFVVLMMGVDMAYLCTKFDHQLQPFLKYGWCPPNFIRFM